MASGSPRNRIDKFFASKKRKPVSPGLKSGRTEKDAKHTSEISPSSKGTLDNYLRTSQDGNDAAKPTSITSRRNLSLDIDSSSKNDGGRPLPAQVHSQSSQSSKSLEKFQNELPQDESKMANTAPSEDHSLSAQGMKSTELKEFATNFLSLYCSEVHSQANSPTEPKPNDRKRQGSFLLDGEDKTSKKRHLIPSQLPMEGETEGSNKKNLEVIQSSLNVGGGENSPNISREITVGGSNVVELQASLRKCTRESKSVLHINEFSTPSSSISKARTRDTPQSARGSSIFSPGEAFWNEAIQLADGLFAQTNEFSPQGAEDTNIQVSQCKKHNSYNLGSESAVRKVREMLVEGESSVSHVGVGGPLEPSGKPKKEIDNEVSPLPVKHLDFSFEGKKMGSSKPHVSLHDTELPEFGSTSHKGSSTTKMVTQHHELETTKEVQEIQGKASILAVTKRKGPSLGQYSESTKIKTPVDGIKNSNSIGYIVPTEAGTPSSSIILKDRLSLKSWLPSEICSIYEKKGISELYPWQVDCLQVDGVLQRRNLVYCASTSAGKSFVAEILMLRRVISTGKMALLVLPYVSICAEKAEHLEVLLEPLGKHVRSYYGSQGGGTLPKDTSVAVCTIEKANSLINRLLEEGRLSEIGIIVIDELHMVGDQNRGYLLELLLTKLRYAAGEGNSESSSGESSGSSSGKADPARALQIVGMSATMPNVEAVADWLQAALYQTEFRPVPLEEFIKIGNTIYNKNMEIVRTISRAADLGGKDPDHVVELCNEVVQEGHSVLIFCSSRKGCESTARHVSKFLKKFSANVSANNSEFADITSAIDSLRRCPAGLDPILEETLPSGIAYHHAGLTVEEREIIEFCYRKGLVRVLTATSTLAAGVNLPARRVIFRQPRIGLDFLDGTRYKQMAGRAGRTGIDTKGESVLICKPEEVKRIMGLLNRSCPPLESCLSEDKNGMTHAILEVVAGGIVQTASDINRYVRCTLLNSTKPFEDVVKSAQDSLRWLCHKKFLDWNDDTKLYGTTPLGRASFGSSLCPEESLIVLDDLSRAREGFVLASDLHLVYLVTPTNVDVEPNWELFYERFMQLPPLDQAVGLRVGVAEPFLMRMAHGAPIRNSNRSRDNQKGLRGKFENQIGLGKNNMPSDEQTLRVCKRFYVALILARLVQEAPVGEVCEAFRVARGMVQALQENAGRFASMVSVFCERLGWHDLEGLVAKFQNRVCFGVRAEIVELTTIPYVKGSRARALYKAGLRTPLAIAEASIPEIAKALFESSTWAAQESTAQRRLQLGVAKKIKNGARRIVLDKAEEARVAAFSAFKSLGLSIPQLSKPLLVTSSNQSGDDSPGRSNEVGQTVNVSSAPMIEGKGDLVQVSSENNGKESSVSYLAASPQLNSAGLQNPQVPTGSRVTERELVGSSVPHSKSAINGTHTGTTGHVGHHDQGVEDQANKNLCSGSKIKSGGKGPINAASIPGGFDSFLELWKSIPEFYFDIHYNQRSEVSSCAPFEIHGISVCWESSPVYYVNLPKDLLCSNNRRTDIIYDSIPASSSNCNHPSPENCLEFIKDRWRKIGDIMRKSGVRKVTWNLKAQIHVLRSPVVSIQRYGYLNLGGKDAGNELAENSFLPLSSVLVKDGIDMCIVAWILWPDEGTSSPNLEKEIKKRLSNEAVAAANLCGRWKNQMRRAAHNGCCRRVAQIRALCSALWKLLISEELVQVLLSIEAPLVNVLAEMELWGIGVDMEGCLWARNLLGKKLRCLEKEAYKLAGMTFSLHTPADIANVLYGHLKLPIPEGLSKGKQHPSTNKHSLDLLRDEHPIIPVIKEHRTLAKLLGSTLGSMSSRSTLSSCTQKYTLHGRWLQTSTATGRLSMEEPNLQNVEHMLEIKLTKNKNGGDTSYDCYEVNARDYFVPTQDNWLLLTADYSQIELRLMAHFSKDSALIELLSKPQGDVFTMMAALWTGKQEDTIGSRERDQTKRLVYGILYGMGADTLAEQLSCSRDEAKEKIKSFKSAFPGVAIWLQEAVSTCHQKGYVQTLKGRKRFLSKIKSGNSNEKSRAQRQAVNSICQGSAADIIKIAMIDIYSVIVGERNELDSSSLRATNFHMLKDRCRILLQVHDELVLEADPSVMKEAALLLQMSMEHAASLLVPLRVKLKVGKTWGSLESFSADDDIDEVLSKLGSPKYQPCTVENEN